MTTEVLAMATVCRCCSNPRPQKKKNKKIHRKFHIYEARLFVLFLFCMHEIHRTRMLQIAFLFSLESFRGGGVHRLGFMAFGLAV
jgi:coenzyme F420-reducing hydrogenase beta subunit